MTIERGDGEDGTRELSAEQLALWDSLIERVRANPTEPALAAILGLANELPLPWRRELRADCYRARVTTDRLTAAGRCLYAYLREWGQPPPPNHDAALTAVRACGGEAPEDRR
jgi:hypothetical protein